MGNLTKKTITRGAVVALALSAGAATTANAAVTRVSGADRYATATQVAAAWPTTPDTAILAAGSGHNVDALTVAPLAKKLNAPIILVDATATPATIVAQFSAYKTVYIANGTGVITPAVETALAAAGKTVTRLGGSTRYETALKIAQAFGTATDIVVANGDDAHLVDSLSIASIAAAKGMPIFLSSANSLDSAEATFAKGVGAKNVYVLGGSTVVSDAAAAGLGTVTRLAGATRYATNVAVVTNFKSDADLDLSNIYVASGEDANLIDSLVAAPLAGLKKAPIVFDHDGNNTDTNTFLNSGIITKDTNVTVLGGLGAVTADAAGAIQNIEVPGSYVPTGTGTDVGPLAVSSVTATGATTLQVKFNKAPADTSKDVFSVTREGTVVAVTTSWDTTNTIATLTYASNLPEDTYSIDVKDGATDLGTSTVAITAQKIAKITITSTTLGVGQPITTAATTTSAAVTTSGDGYATYKVFDQYGNDITTSGLAQGIQWTCGVGTPTASNGLIDVSPFAGSSTYLTSYTTATVNAIDQSTGTVASANLTISTTPATLSNITFNKIICPGNPNAVFTAGDTTDTFYVDYTATDLSGNPTTNLKLIEAGLMSTGLTSSNPAVTVSIVPDPANSNNALIQVTPNNSTVLSDQPVVISAFTTNGKAASLNVTLKKALTLDKFTLMAPSQTVAEGDTNVIIPFTALDQNGNTLTKYSDIYGSASAPNVTFSGSIQPKLIDNPDGTASLQLPSIIGYVTGTLTSQSLTIQASTSTGKFSSINLMVQKKATPNTLAVSTTEAVPNMECNAVQNLDFGPNFGGLKVTDQYGRTMDLVNQDINSAGAVYYYVEATTPAAITNPSVAIANGANKAYGNMNIQMQASSVDGAGSTTITYTVYQHTNATASTAASDVSLANIVTPIVQQYTVLKATDVTGYTIAKVGTLYDIADASSTSGAITKSTAEASFKGEDLGDFQDSPKVFGTTTGGGQVALQNQDLISATVDNTTDFVANLSENGLGSNASVGVYAKNTLNSTKLTATGNLSVVILGHDGNTYTATTALNSKDDQLIAKSVGFSVAQASSGVPKGGVPNVYANPTWNTGVSISGNNVYAPAALVGSNLINNVVSKYDTATGNTGSASLVYIYGADQYGTWNAPISTWSVKTTNAGYTLSVDATNTLRLTPATTAPVLAPVKGDTITLTGVSSNGLVESVNIIVQ